MAHFIACHKTYDTLNVANLFFKEIIRLQGVPRTIVSDQDAKFLSHFLENLMGQVRHQAFVFYNVPPQMDGQTEVVNRAIIKKNLKTWEECLPHIKFAYNRPVHSATKHSPSEVVYGFNPLTPLDLVPLLSNQLVHVDGKRKADFVKQLHQRVKENIERRIEQYAHRVNKGLKQVVSIHIRKERFPKQRKPKVLPRGDDLPSDYGVNASFNVADLSHFLVGDDLGTNHHEEGGMMRAWPMS
ncbi:Transposon Ty3-I Gag-Pol polyprotein [Gossypium australe]|uniref:Transposon Ty3-I Gag-Pol polyprotein n=1 Tax=Gossypium australe TaxID=47621 RepID=A0A5B6VPI8_9ROSI|nr:Transposon Ty3-I Gag-Pol polyprotein [Gossypium australe]